MNYKKMIRLIIVMAILAAVAMAVLYLVNNGRFRVVSITPKPGKSVPTATSTMKVVFNRDLSPEIKAETLLPEPPEFVRSIEFEPRTILIKFAILEKDKQYSLILRDIRSSGGDAIAELDLSFTAKYVPFEKLSREQQELEISQTDRGNKTDPIEQYLPHGGLTFELRSIRTTDDSGEYALFLEARLFLSESDVATGRSAAIKRREQEVKAFIRSKGLDPENYAIRYEVEE